MKTTPAEDLALETFLSRWDYDSSFRENLRKIADKDYDISPIGVKESYDHIHPIDLSSDILWLANNIQKLLDREIKKVAK